MSDVVVTGVPRSGARTLAQALSAVDASVRAVALPPDAIGARSGMVGLLVVEPSALTGDDDLAALAALRAAHRAGLRAELAWTDSGPELRAYAEQRGIRRWVRGAELQEVSA